MDNLKQNAAPAGSDLAAMGDEAQPEEVLQPVPELDDELKAALGNKRHRSSEYREMIEFRSRLPAYDMRKAILKCIEDNQVVVLSGETGEL